MVDVAEILWTRLLIQIFLMCVLLLTLLISVCFHFDGTGFSSAAPADRWQNVVWLSRSRHWCQTPHRSRSSGLRPQRGHVYRYMGLNTQKGCRVTWGSIIKEPCIQAHGVQYTETVHVVCSIRTCIGLQVERVYCAQSCS